MGLILLSALLILVSFAATTELDSPDAFPGLKGNRSGLVLMALVLGLAALRNGRCPGRDPFLPEEARPPHRCPRPALNAA
ncbi:hypothetical protein AB0G35_13140 [Streptomyces sp. NPDC021749]|uniref:hypothetical protein n=1 Tax=Streptomyces sp. NPDC021749 TaxID=3154905 RepID=UPI0034099F5F